MGESARESIRLRCHLGRGPKLSAFPLGVSSPSVHMLRGSRWQLSGPDCRVGDPAEGLDPVLAVLSRQISLSLSFCLANKMKYKYTNLCFFPQRPYADFEKKKTLISGCVTVSLLSCWAQFASVTVTGALTCKTNCTEWSRERLQRTPLIAYAPDGPCPPVQPEPAFWEGHGCGHGIPSRWSHSFPSTPTVETIQNSPPKSSLCRALQEKTVMLRLGGWRTAERGQRNIGDAAATAPP